METIRAVVRNLVFLVLLMGFLEMLLPLRGTRRFLQVVLGMFVLVTVLNPVVAFFRQKPILSIDIAGNSAGETAELSSILRGGESLQRVTLERAQKSYEERLEEQIAAIARLVPGVRTASAQVFLSDNWFQAGAGGIERVVIAVDVEKKIKPVEKIRVNEEQKVYPQSSQLNPSGDEIADKVRDTVASLFGLRAEQVVVNVD
ncbi:MAG: stage III sporulation protein AF [Thermacetogeniaceae bacterium]